MYGGQAPACSSASRNGLAIAEVDTRDELAQAVGAVEPAQQTPIDRPDVPCRLLQAAITMREDHDTPDEVYCWYGLDDIKTKIEEDHHETAT